MRANEGTLVAFDTVGWVPKWDSVSDGSLLSESDVGVHGAIEELVLGEFARWELIAIKTIDGADVFVVVGIAGILGSDLGGWEVDPFWFDLDFAETSWASVDGIVVVLDDIHTLLGVGLLDELLHPFLSLFVRHDFW